MHRDYLQDLAFYEPVEPWQPRRQEFVWEAMRRIGRHEHIYTRLLPVRLRTPRCSNEHSGIQAFSPVC